MPRTKEIFARLDALEKNVTDLDEEVFGDASFDYEPKQSDELSARDEFVWKYGFSKGRTLLKSISADDFIGMYRESMDEYINIKAPPADSRGTNRIDAEKIEYLLDEIKRLEAEIALRGERLEYLFMRYAYQRKPMPYISGWFKDGKYIGGESKEKKVRKFIADDDISTLLGVKEKTCTACSNGYYYDDEGVEYLCGACNGTGKYIGEVKEKTCEWTTIRIYEGEEIMTIGCKPDSSRVALLKHGFNYCPYCGGKIAEADDEIK